MEDRIKHVSNWPAFPRNSLTGEDPGGMVLKDYFAGQALSGMLANSYWNHADDETIAEAAYTFADAMIKRICKGD